MKPSHTTSLERMNLPVCLGGLHLFALAMTGLSAAQKMSEYVDASVLLVLSAQTILSADTVIRFSRNLPVPARIFLAQVALTLALALVTDWSTAAAPIFLLSSALLALRAPASVIVFAGILVTSTTLQPTGGWGLGTPLTVLTSGAVYVCACALRLRHRLAQANPELVDLVIQPQRASIASHLEAVLEPGLQEIASVAERAQSLLRDTDEEAERAALARIRQLVGTARATAGASRFYLREHDLQARREEVAELADQFTRNTAGDCTIDRIWRALRRPSFARRSP